MAAAARPQVMGPGDDDDEDVVPEVTREELAKRRRAAEEAKRLADRQSMTRRSWYVKAEVADEFQRAVDDIHFATRAPKHEVVAALLVAAVGQADRVQRKLTPKG